MKWAKFTAFALFWLWVTALGWRVYRIEQRLDRVETMMVLQSHINLDMGQELDALEEAQPETEANQQ